MTTEKKYNYFYKTTNLVNGKYYYGIRSTDKDPLKDSYLGSGKNLKRAIKKYGRENFKKEILIEFPTRQEVSDYECEIVTMELVLDENCYNLKTGGDNGFIFSDDSKKKIGLANSGENSAWYGKYHTNETKKKISDQHIGKKLTEEHKDKLSKSHFGKNLTEEHKDKIRKGNIGKIMSEEAKNKVRMFNKGKIVSNETRQKISQSHKGKKLSEESKAKLSKFFKGRPPTHYKSCLINDIFFKSIMAASRHYNESIQCIRYRLKSKTDKWKNWNYV